MSELIKTQYKDQEFVFKETPTVPALIKEIFNDNYKVFEKKIPFKKGDVILDLGANEGMFSILMSRFFPETRIISLEPVRETYFNLIRNKALNNCQNIEAYNVGVGKPGDKFRDFVVGKFANSFSGGSSGAMATFDPEHHRRETVGLISIDEVFEMYKIDHCQLMKIDIEGMEHDALYPAEKSLVKTEYLAAELHINSKLEFEGRRLDGLANWLSNRVKLIHIEYCRMAE